jgi:hypothetical protein
MAAPQLQQRILTLLVRTRKPWGNQTHVAFVCAASLSCGAIDTGASRSMADMVAVDSMRGLEV